MGLVLDFVPNHTGFDHPWISSHPERYVGGSLERFRAAPYDFRLVEPAHGGARFIACGRDPYFPAWTDVAQLNYFEPDTRAAMVGQLSAIAQHCDGVRCDMAMLVLNDVFARTWGALTGTEVPGTEFWTGVREALPDFLLIAEAYWDLEWRLQELGFSYTYDKRLYDRLAHESSAAVRDHLRAVHEYQNRSARFLENHDEPRSFATFGPGRIEAAAAICATCPGLRFYYDGQFEGRTRFAPVQLGRWAEEPEEPGLREFYERLLKAADDRVLHDGDWALLDVAEAGDATHAQLVAFRWRLGDDLRVIISNPGDQPAQGHVLLGGDLPGAAPKLVFEDQIADGRYEWDRAALIERGLYVRLAPGRAHLFRVEV
jgi:glycosidase